MCLAVPVEVLSIDENNVAECRVGESETKVNASLMLLEGQVESGDFLILHAGFAIRKLDPQEAEESLRILREMAEQAQASGAFDDPVPDLGGKWSAD